MRRTGMAFQRTRLAQDRTLMAVIRTALSMIGFGFTIFSFFQKLGEEKIITHSEAPRNFGISLVLLGILILVLGIASDVWYMVGLREQRRAMMADQLLHGESVFPVSYTLIVACLLFLIGAFAIVSMLYHIGPFG
ncbi:MAG TPA: DUF202 domain-containing protein [Casimicrobiaceae bacterium]|nr:DUF202 domain-containing protein [Casimicrobiaceae bacterium]